MFLTLPSNASLDVYPDNKISQFSVHLPKEIDLTGSWEVAIAEIFYVNSWYNIDETKTYKIFFRRGGFMARAKITPGFYLKPKQVIRELQESLYRDWESAVVNRKTSPGMSFDFN